MGDTPRIVVLAGLEEPLVRDARGARAAATFDLVMALAEFVEHVGKVAVDLVARRGSKRILPTITLDPEELGHGGGAAGDRWREDAIYFEWIRSGGLREYDLVHVLADLVTPILLADMMGASIVRSVTPAGDARPVDQIVSRLARPGSVHSVGTRLFPEEPRQDIPFPVDLTRYRLDVEGARGPLVCTCPPHDPAHAVATRVARGQDLPLAALGAEDAPRQLAAARALLDLGSSPGLFEATWALRSLAVGTPVVGWVGGPVEKLAEGWDGGEGLARAVPLGDVHGLDAAVRELPMDASAQAARRDFVLGTCGGRRAAASWSWLYRELLGLD